MARIDIRRMHGQTLKTAKTRVEKTAKAIARKFGLDNEWDGDTLNFRRSGVNGHIHVTQKEVVVIAELGFLLGALKPMIEDEIRRQLAEHFD